MREHLIQVCPDSIVRQPPPYKEKEGANIHAILIGDHPHRKNGKLLTLGIPTKLFFSRYSWLYCALLIRFQACVAAVFLCLFLYFKFLSVA